MESSTARFLMSWRMEFREFEGLTWFIAKAWAVGLDRNENLIYCSV